MSSKITYSRQRRIWFSLHVIVYALSCLLVTVDPVLIALRSVLLATVVLHFHWLYIVGLYEASLVAMTEQVYATVPLLPDGQRQVVSKADDGDDFWYRWHDL